MVFVCNYFTFVCNYFTFVCGFSVITIAPTIASSNIMDVIINHIELITINHKRE